MSTDSLLTPWLIETITRGDAVLFLGAGASMGARGKGGEQAPSGNALRDLLADRFLGGALKDKPLSQVAELAKNEAGLPEVQALVASVFNELQPAPFHLLIPTFRWYAVVTTNFDLVLERAYGQCPSPEQKLSPVISDGDNFSAKLRDLSQVLYLKLHGCITRTTDPQLPLILASEEYAKHRKNRDRLFRHFADWARERPVIFCGYDVGDPNIQQILFDLGDLGIQRPPYGLVNPSLNDFTERYWTARRFVTARLSFEDFLAQLDATIPRASRTLGALVKSDNVSIRPWIKTHAAPTTSLCLYLQDELLHLTKSMPTRGVDPSEFFRGQSDVWGAYAQDLDVRRRVSDDMVLASHLDKSNQKLAQIYLLKGHAGSGKTVALRRCAWDIAHLYDGFVFALREGGVLRQEQLAELFALTGERAILLIDDAIPRLREILELRAWAEKRSIPLTLLIGARTNEWNVYGSELERFVDEDWELRDLTEREITQLLERLEKHKALGRLAAATPEERVAHFRLTAERQLLVALHDISGEKSFEQIVVDEYENIRPQEAKLLYLDVCTLHRLGVGIRAGLVSRISGITFSAFEREFFRPLEHVVHAYFDREARDNAYRSRHRLIAEIVFKEVLREPVDRANQLVRIIRNMDIDYSSDRAAFFETVRGRALADLFSDKALANQIFRAAEESGADVNFVEHQRAVFEMQHRGGDLRAALAAIEKAEAAVSGSDRSILHTKAAILRSLANVVPQRLERENLRSRAKTILEKLLKGSRVSHPYHTAGQLCLDELRDKLDDLARPEVTTPAELQDRTIAELIRGVEEAVSEGLQRFPGDSYLLSLEADLARLLQEHSRASEALSRAFNANPGRSYVAVRLAHHLCDRGEAGKAKEILKSAIAVNPSGKEVHFALARLLIAEDERGNQTQVVYHLKRGFTPGDSHLEAQFWYARHCFLFGQPEQGMAAFKALAESAASGEDKRRVRNVLANHAGERVRLAGWVKSIHESFCFVHAPDYRIDIFAHSKDIDDEEWRALNTGKQVTFELGFTLRGPVALRVRSAQ